MPPGLVAQRLLQAWLKEMFLLTTETLSIVVNASQFNDKPEGSGDRVARSTFNAKNASTPLSFGGAA